MKKSNKYVVICLIIISIIQVVIFIRHNINNTVMVDTINGYNKETLTFKNIKEELLDIKQLKVLEIENNDETWNARIVITGDKNSIKKGLSLLKNYKIISYNIDGSNDKLKVTVDIVR